MSQNMWSIYPSHKSWTKNVDGDMTMIYIDYMYLVGLNVNNKVVCLQEFQFRF